MSPLSSEAKETAFAEFKRLCGSEGLLQLSPPSNGEDTSFGICDDSALWRFLRARSYNPQNALKQYKTTREWRDANRLIELYDSINVSNYEETRKLYTHWTGRRDNKGTPLCLFDIGKLTADVMTAYEKSCSSNLTISQSTQTESEATLRLFCTYENLIRFVLPLCSADPSRPEPEEPVSDTTCIVDISGVSLWQFFKLRNHMQAASALATAHYPETLGKTFIIGAPSYFPTVWGWINKWFDQNTVSKIFIIPPGKELSMLSEYVDPSNIPSKYGGQHEFSFGMHPELDPQLESLLQWVDNGGAEGIIPARGLPEGPMRWVTGQDGTRSALAVGSEGNTERNLTVFQLKQQ